MCFCMAVPKQMKSEFCSLLCHQYLILHVITTSILSQVQQLCMFRESRLHTYFSSFVNIGKTPKLLFSIRHQHKTKVSFCLHCSVSALTFRNHWQLLTQSDLLINWSILKLSLRLLIYYFSCHTKRDRLVCIFGAWLWRVQKLCCGSSLHPVHSSFCFMDH